MDQRDGQVQQDVLDRSRRVVTQLLIGQWHRNEQQQRRQHHGGEEPVEPYCEYGRQRSDHIQGGERTGELAVASEDVDQITQECAGNSDRYGDAGWDTRNRRHD